MLKKPSKILPYEKARFEDHFHSMQGRTVVDKGLTEKNRPSTRSLPVYIERESLGPSKACLLPPSQNIHMCRLTRPLVDSKPSLVYSGKVGNDTQTIAVLLPLGREFSFPYTFRKVDKNFHTPRVHSTLFSGSTLLTEA